MIEFKKRSVVTSFLDPREGFSPKEIETEFRIDPLTGESGRVAHIGIRPQKDDLSKWDAPGFKQHCPFCPSNIESMTPRFPSDLLPSGRINRGEATVIPNIAPYDRYSALTVMSRDHLVPLDMLIQSSILDDSFQAGLDFCRLVSQKEPGLPYIIIAWNYMPPSGGGLMHPHQQLIITDSPGNLYLKTLRACERYLRQHGKNYWEELCDREEEIGERYIGSVGRGRWLAAFNPLGALGEFTAVFPGFCAINGLDEPVLQDLIEGLRRLFRYFDSFGIYSFNMGLFFAPETEAGHFSLHARIVPRTFVNLFQNPPDANFFHFILQEPFTVIRPEEHCKGARPFFAAP